jgi:hypothetical protein
MIQSSGKAWYAPKNTTHFFLCAFLISSGVCTLFLLVFRQQIHSGVAEFCTSMSPNPTRDTTPTIFEENVPFQTLDQSADMLWKSVVPPNGGFIIDESRNDTGIYGVAMFHQLHCLQMFRSDFQGLYAKIAGLESGEKMKRHGNMHEIDLPHTLHCLDYLRQVQSPLCRFPYPFTDTCAGISVLR